MSASEASVWTADPQRKQNDATSAGSMAKAIQATAVARRVVIFTGAGMSADSGIGTFRGQGGTWSGITGKLALLWGGTPIGWKWTPGYVWRRFVLDFYGPIAKAQPHAGHKALEALFQKGDYESVVYITMNVDGLHQTSGASNDRVAEVHGSVLKYRCMSCDKKLTNILPNKNAGIGPTSSDQAKASRPASTEADTGSALLSLNPKKQPRCDVCGGRARPDVTLFTESLPMDEWDKACTFIEHLGEGDVLLVAGTSSVVYPAASLPEQVAASGDAIPIIEFNLDVPTPLSSIVDITVQGRAAETLPLFVERVLAERAKQRTR